jgi:N-acetyl-gamma-glutamyl-phosphate reductase
LKSGIRVGILGAGGFTGQELIGLISRHNATELVYVTSSEYANKKLCDAFPGLETAETGQLLFSAHPHEISDVPALDVIFLATPDDVSLKWAPEFVRAGVRVIDISGAFRLRDAAVFKEFYGLDQTAPDLLQQATYGMTELYRKEIKTAKLVANPGCYPTAAILPLYVYRDALDFSRPLIVDAKSGTSGAGGRKEKDGLGYSTVYENFRAYRTAKHQHAPEIAQEVSGFANIAAQLRFTPHLLPMYRGILSVTYAFARKGLREEDLVRAGESAAAAETFLRHRSGPDAVELRHVQHTNYCDYAHYFDEKNGLVQIVSAIDNLMKGAAGQAMQNLNVMFDLPEDMGVA